MTGSVKNRLLALHHFLLPPHLGLGWAPYVWIAYIGFLFFPFLFGAGTRAELVATLLTLVIFLPLYFLGFRCSGRAGAAVVLALTALGVLTATFNSGASVYFIFAASFSAFVGPPRLAIRLLGVIVLTAAVETWFLSLSPVFLAITVIVSVMLGLSNMYWRQMDIKNRELRASQGEIRRLAATAERERIARDLHDLLGHTLASVALKAELARKLVGKDPDAAVREIAEVEQIARSATAEVRQAVSGYRACSVSGEAIRGRRHLENLGVEVVVALSPDATLDPETDNVLGLVLREAITNVARHARASTCRIELAATADTVALTVEDDGVGGASFGLGTGLRGMRERIDLISGRLTVDLSPLGGVRIRAETAAPLAGALEASIT